MAIEYRTTVNITCDKCLSVTGHVQTHTRDDIEAVYRTANLLFYRAGWALYRNKNYCASCWAKKQSRKRKG